MKFYVDTVLNRLSVVDDDGKIVHEIALPASTSTVIDTADIDARVKASKDSHGGYTSEEKDRESEPTPVSAAVPDLAEHRRDAEYFASQESYKARRLRLSPYGDAEVAAKATVKAETKTASSK